MTYKVKNCHLDFPSMREKIAFTGTRNEILFKKSNGAGSRMINPVINRQDYICPDSTFP